MSWRISIDYGVYECQPEPCLESISLSDGNGDVALLCGPGMYTVEELKIPDPNLQIYRSFRFAQTATDKVHVEATIRTDKKARAFFHEWVKLPVSKKVLEKVTRPPKKWSREKKVIQ